MQQRLQQPTPDYKPNWTKLNIHWFHWRLEFWPPQRTPQTNWARFQTANIGQTYNSHRDTIRPTHKERETIWTHTTPNPDHIHVKVKNKPRFGGYGHWLLRLVMHFFSNVTSVIHLFSNFTVECTTTHPAILHFPIWTFPAWSHPLERDNQRIVMNKNCFGGFGSGLLLLDSLSDFLTHPAILHFTLFHPSLLLEALGAGYFFQASLNSFTRPAILHFLYLVLLLTCSVSQRSQTEAGQYTQ